MPKKKDEVVKALLDADRPKCEVITLERDVVYDATIIDIRNGENPETGSWVLIEFDDNTATFASGNEKSDVLRWGSDLDNIKNMRDGVKVEVVRTQVQHYKDADRVVNRMLINNL